MLKANEKKIKLLFALAFAFVISSCGQQRVVYTPPPKPKKDELKLMLEKIYKTEQKLEKLKKRRKGTEQDIHLYTGG